MKRKGQKRKEKILLSKRNTNSKLEDFFRPPSNIIFNSPKIKIDTSPLNTNKKLCIVRNPSKNRLTEESKEELKKFHNLANNTILCDYTLIDKLYAKLNSSFEKIDRFIMKNKKCETKNINKKELITKFILQLKYTDVVYLSPILLSEKFNEDNIAQNIRNFAGFRNLKGVTMNFSPNNKKECEMIWPNITDIIFKYLNSFHEGKGLYIYVEHDYLSYIDKIKLLCNLNNYETVLIDETNQAKCIILDKLSEAMQTKRLPSISEQLGTQMLMLEEMVNSFSYKWKIFRKKEDENTINNKNSIDENKFISNNIDNNYSNNTISNNTISYNSSKDSKNESFILSNRDIDKVCEEIEFDNKNNSTIGNNNNKGKKYIKIDESDEDYSKNDQLSTNETLYTNFRKRGKNKNKNNEKFDLVLNNRDKSKSKSRNKSKDKSKNNSRNKSSEVKKRRNKKNEENINNTNIKGFFNENTKEHKTFTQLQNNIFLYCTNSKTAIIIADSFSDDDKDKKYFNNILLKISQTKCPIIVLTNNLNNIYNNTQKKIKNLNINCILCPKNKRDMTLIYLYNFIIYINIKLCSFKFSKDINSYEKFLECINNIDTDTINFDLCIFNLKNIFTLSEYLCYYGKFQMDIIDFKLSEIFLNVEKEINNNKIDPKDFSEILNYIYNSIFINKDNISPLLSEEKNIDEIYEDYEMKSFLDYSDGMQAKLINKNYENKLKLNDSYDNYFNSKDSMVNLEGLTLGKYFNNEEIFRLGSNNNNHLEDKKSFSIYDTIDNKIIDKINKEDQLIISNYKKQFIPISSLTNYIYPIKRKIIINKNMNKYRITYYIKKKDDEPNDFLDIHNFKKVFQKIEGNYFINKNNIDFATNYMLKKSFNQKKIVAKFYEK